MSAEPIARDPAEHVDVRHDQSKDPLYEVLDHIGQYLSEEGQRKLYADVGQALMRSMAAGDNTYVNREIEAWLRTLVAKRAGADEIMADQPWPEDEEPMSVEELRANTA